MRLSEPAPAKLNLALHVRGKLPDGRHRIETIFAFCVEGDTVHAEPADDLSLTVSGPFAAGLAGADNLVMIAARKLREASGANQGAALYLDKKLPIASGIGGGSADAAAALRLLTRLWRTDPTHAEAVAPKLGADVPACLLSLTARGDGAGEKLVPTDAGIAGAPVLLINPKVPLGTRDVFAAWDGVDHGELADWRTGRNDLESTATRLVPQISLILAWLAAQPGAEVVRMSGSGATCFALFADEESRDRAAAAVPREWWHLATRLR